MTEYPSTVMVVDDDPGIKALFEVWLGDEHEVLTAGNGREALEQLHDDVDVVVLDRDMPVMSGDQFLRHCREEEWDCRVLLVTGQEPDGEVLRLGFDAYLGKPVEGDTLRAAVAMLLRRQQYNRKIKEYLSITSRLAVLDVESLDNGGRESYHELVRRREVLEDEIDLLATGSGRLDVEAEVHQFHTAAEGD